MYSLLMGVGLYRYSLYGNKCRHVCLFYWRYCLPLKIHKRVESCFTQNNGTSVKNLRYIIKRDHCGVDTGNRIGNLTMKRFPEVKMSEAGHRLNSEASRSHPKCNDSNSGSISRRSYTYQLKPSQNSSAFLYNSAVKVQKVF